MNYYIILNGNVITTLGGTSRKIPNSATPISKSDYENYKAILKSIPNRAGYTKKVTLYIDGTYEVEYTEIVEVEEENED